MPPSIEQLDNEIRALKNELESLNVELRNHDHSLSRGEQIKYFDIFGEAPSKMPTYSQTIATTGNTDWYIIAPISARLISVDFSGTNALATSDTNYITFSIVNLGRAGSGTTNLLGTGDNNTTKATGGTALSADTVRELILSTTVNATQVVAGDRLRIRAAASGTLVNTVTNSVFMLRFA